MPLQPQRVNIPISGGLTQDETPEYLDPPALYVCDNFYHDKRSGLTKRNGYDMIALTLDAREYQENGDLQNTGPQLLTNCPIDRFIRDGNAVTFAAKGYLYRYDPGAFAAASTISPRPNTVRIGAIPDIQINRSESISIAHAGPNEYIREASVAYSPGGMSCLAVLSRVASSDAVTVTVRGPSGEKIDSIDLGGSGNSLSRVCTAYYGSGFFASVLDFTNHEILSVKYDLSSATWTYLSFPTVTIDGNVMRADWYDLCPVNGHDVAIAIVPILSIWSTGAGSVTEDGAVIEFTYSPQTNTITRGPYHIGTTGWTGDPSGPKISVAGNAAGDIGITWVNGPSKRVYFSSVTSGSFRPVTELTPLVASSPITAVACCALSVASTSEETAAAWNALFEYEDSHLTYFATIRHSVSSFVLDADSEPVDGTGVRSFYSSRIISTPWCANGVASIVMAPDTQRNLGEPNTADIPFIVTRTWDDKWWPRVEVSPPCQLPFGVWGYGEAMPLGMPIRVGLDASAQGLIGVAGVVHQDPFLPGYGAKLSITRFDALAPGRYDSAELPGGGTMFGCAQPWTFDGETAFESAFVQRPVIASSTQAASMGALKKDLTANDYHYFRVIFEAIDATGCVCSSPVSVTSKIQITADGNSITLKIPNLFWTGRKSGAVRARVYMCRDNETFLLAGETTIVDTDALGNPVDVLVTVTAETDGVSPAPPTIYTYDGTLESGYPQLATQLTRWNNRIWLSSDSDLSYSHFFLPGVSPSFPDIFTESIDRDISALLALDDRILVFANDAVMARSGEGPNLNGQGGSYSSLSFITHHVGCSNPRSVFYSMPGVFFQSRRGIELMDVQGGLQHVRAIEDYFAPTSIPWLGHKVAGVCSMPREHQARVLFRDPSTLLLSELVFDYSTGTWSRWTSSVAWEGGAPLLSVGDVTIVGDIIYIATGDGKLLVEVPGRKYDAIFPPFGTPTHEHINWSVKTPWIKADGLLGVQRVWRSVVALKAQAWNDPPYMGAPTAYLGVTATESIDYGNTSVSHGGKTIVQLQTIRNAATGIVNLQIGHKYQQCSSYQLHLSSIDNNSWNYTADVSGVTEILGIWSEFGVEPGTGRGRKEAKI